MSTNSKEDSRHEFAMLLTQMKRHGRLLMVPARHQFTVRRLLEPLGPPPALVTSIVTESNGIELHKDEDWVLALFGVDTIGAPEDTPPAWTLPKATTDWRENNILAREDDWAVGLWCFGNIIISSCRGISEWSPVTRQFELKNVSLADWTRRLSVELSE